MNVIANVVPIDATLPRLNRLEAHARRLGVIDAARYLRLHGQPDLAAELVREIDQIAPEPEAA